MLYFEVRRKTKTQRKMELKRDLITQTPLLQEMVSNLGEVWFSVGAENVFTWQIMQSRRWYRLYNASLSETLKVPSQVCISWGHESHLCGTLLPL